MDIASICTFRKFRAHRYFHLPPCTTVVAGHRGRANGLVVVDDLHGRHGFEALSRLSTRTRHGTLTTVLGDVDGFPLLLVKAFFLLTWRSLAVLRRTMTMGKE